MQLYEYGMHRFRQDQLAQPSGNSSSPFLVYATSLLFHLKCFPLCNK